MAHSHSYLVPQLFQSVPNLPKERWGGMEHGAHHYSSSFSQAWTSSAQNSIWPIWLIWLQNPTTYLSISIRGVRVHNINNMRQDTKQFIYIYTHSGKSSPPPPPKKKNPKNHTPNNINNKGHRRETAKKWVFFSFLLFFTVKTYTRNMGNCTTQNPHRQR